MRPAQNNNNNYKNRNRNRNRRNTGGGGGGGGGGNSNNRVLDSNGPDVKLRGTAQTIAEKYMQMARDAHSSGDRVMAESYYQHADHYYRLWLAAQPAGQPIQFPRRLDEDVEDLEGGEGEDDGAPEGVNGQVPEGAEGSVPVEQSAEGEGQGQANDDGSQNRNFRPRENRGENRDQNGGNRSGRNRWPRRNDRYTENREGNAPAPEGTEVRGEGGEAPVENQERPERPERSERPPRRERFEAAPAAEDKGDWEAPSFLKRPLPVVAGDDGADAPAPERKPRARRPRYGEEGVTANDPPTSEE